MHLVEDHVVRCGEVVEAQRQAHHEEGDRHEVHRDVEGEGVVGTPLEGDWILICNLITQNYPKHFSNCEIICLTSLE